MGLNQVDIKKNEIKDEMKDVKVINDKLNEEKTSTKKPDTLFLYFTVFTGTLILLVGATTIIWSGPAVVQLRSNNTEMNPIGRPLETIELSMMIGIPLMTALLGGALLPRLSDIIGRKKSLQVIGAVLLMSQIGLAFSNRVYLIIIFMSINSNIYSGMWGLLPIYLTEVCEDHNRAKFGCLSVVFLPVGQLYAFIAAKFFNIRDFTLVNSLPLVAFLILFFIPPESPVYLLKKNRREECMEALARLRSNKTSEELEKDFEKISHSIAVQQETKHSNKKLKLFNLFKTKEGRLGLALAILPILVQYLSGLPILMSLLAPIVNETNTISGDTMAIIVGVIMVISYIVTSLIIERTGRKPLLVISAGAAGVPITVLGIYFYLKHINSPAIDQLKFLPFLAVVTFVIMYSAGLGPIPTAVMSELFPSDLRPVAVAFISMFTGVILSIYFFIFPLLADYLGLHWCFWIFGACCFIGAFVMFLVLPETKGKSVVEIQKVLKEY